MMKTGMFAYVFFAAVLLYFIVVVILFVMGIGCLVMALGHGDREKLPSHLKFNPLNILINEGSLDQFGKRYRKLAFKYLTWFILSIAAGILMQLLVQFFDK